MNAKTGELLDRIYSKNIPFELVAMPTYIVCRDCIVRLIFSGIILYSKNQKIMATSRAISCLTQFGDPMLKSAEFGDDIIQMVVSNIYTNFDDYQLILSDMTEIEIFKMLNN